jgi:hypothetical protein
MKHGLVLAAVTALVWFCTLLPFLPGRHDSLAVPLSSMAQVGGTLGLVLVPIGAAWLAAERSQRLAGWRYALRVAAAAASSLVAAVVALVAMIQSGFALGILVLLLWVYALVRFRRGSGAASVLPLSLVVVPAAAALMQYPLLERAVTFSRATAIRNSAPLIAAIERYRATNGRYPASLHAVHPDYWPGVVGISRYHYEPHGDAYNLFFEQFTYRLGTREFVMYNPRDEHAMTSHALDLLELTPEQLGLEQTRGHYARHDAPEPHWKYFWFD